TLAPQRLGFPRADQRRPRQGSSRRAVQPLARGRVADRPAPLALHRDEAGRALGHPVPLQLRAVIAGGVPRQNDLPHREKAMTSVTLAQATAIAVTALARGRDAGLAPLTVAVLDAGGHLVVLQREDGSGILRPDIAIGKAWGALGM